MELIYLDNAATSPMYSEVVTVMQESMLGNFGNPSSVHQFGRKAKVVVETARKNIAKQFNVTASEIVFTASGTEANNMVLQNAVINLGVKRIITSKIEHHAVLDTVLFLQDKFYIEVVYVSLDEFGQVDLNNLEELLKDESLTTLVSLMMVNNEIGNLLPMKEVSILCGKHKALFHSDTVQAIGHYAIDLKEVPVDFIVASAHKFHGPKGVGFLYCKGKHVLKPLLYGGGQENGRRSGTENVHAILGMESALSIVCDDIVGSDLHLLKLKQYFIGKIKLLIKDVTFNGLSGGEINVSNAIVNVRFPFKNSMLLFNTDLLGVAVSSGSACNSGAVKKSHVLKELLNEKEFEKESVRFSFSKMNSIKDIDIALDRLSSLF